MPRLRLTIEMVPASSWGQSLKNILPAKLWQKVRHEVFAKSKFKCSICGSQKNLECHEVWRYDDVTHTQKLYGFLALCKTCHSLKHIGYTTLRGEKSHSDIDSLARHFMKVNKCDRIVFNKHYKRAVELWRQRSKYEWKIIFKKN